MHPLACLNPHCSSPIAHSVPALTLLISTLPYNLPTTLNKLIPLELLHSHLSPFPLYRGTKHAPRQSIGLGIFIYEINRVSKLCNLLTLPTSVSFPNRTAEMFTVFTDTSFETYLKKITSYGCIFNVLFFNNSVRVRVN